MVKKGTDNAGFDITTFHKPPKTCICWRYRSFKIRFKTIGIWQIAQL